MAVDYTYSRLMEVSKYSEGNFEKTGSHSQGVVFNDNYLLAKKTSRFRPFGVVFWAHYTPKGLGLAIKEDTVMDYYLEMLKDERSAKNPYNKVETIEQWRQRRTEAGKLFKHELESLDMLEILEEGGDIYDDDDDHLGCPSYPMCDEAPQGCIVARGSGQVEWYGHKG